MEPLKNVYNQEFVTTFSKAIKNTIPSFNTLKFNKEIFNKDWKNKDPKPILKILNNLKNDKSKYVRRSVANNLRYC